MKLRCNHCGDFYDPANVERAYLPEVGEAHCCSAYCYTQFKIKPKDQPQDTTVVPKREQWEIEHELREWLRLQEYSGQCFLTLDHIIRNYTLTPKT